MCRSTETIAVALEHCDGGPAFKSRPLRLGDYEQIKAMQIMNGDRPYCCVCLAVDELGGVDAVGERCDRPRCRGFYIPGAAMEAKWRRYAYIDGEAA